MIDRIEIVALAALYDLATDPMNMGSEAAIEAARNLAKRIELLHVAEATDMSLGDFRRGVIARCRQWLQKN